MGMDKIDHVVLLMLENRSLDSLLGWIYEDDEPALVIQPPEPGERRFDGLQGLDPTAFQNEAMGVKPSPPIRGASGLNVPFVDPGESFEHVNVQLFGERWPESGATPNMKGYLRDYVDVLKKMGGFDLSIYGKMIMESYTPAQLPILSGLARYYAVCDRWFCSVPSQTNTNRAFSLCGTSRGLVDNGYFEEDTRAQPVEELLGDKVGDDRFHARTIWNALYDAGLQGLDDWMIFWQSPIIPASIHAALQDWVLWKALSKVFGEDVCKYFLELSSSGVESAYVYRLFPQLASIPDVASHFAGLDNFHVQARAGALPRFSYIEPRWNIQHIAAGTTWKQLLEQALSQTGNDYHPPGNVAVGEEHLREIYMSLTHHEEAWKKTLLIITTDEAVGQFDHVLPPKATPPWGDRPPEEGRDLQRDLQYGFDFKRYGARVPTILVSPLIQRGTVFRSTGQQPYDHTSLIATILKWRRLDHCIGEFGERTRGAPTFEDVLTLAEPRTDARDIPFLKSTRKKGDPLCYYDRFYLKGAGGKLLSHAVLTRKSILDPKTEYFPTMGRTPDAAPVMLHFEKADDRPSTAQVKPGDGAKIITTDPEVGAFNVLGAWDDSVDCYYYNDYLTGTNKDKQTWVLRKKGDGPLCFGDEVSLVCLHHSRVLMEDSFWGEDDTTYLKARRFRSATWTVVAPERLG